MRTVKGVAGKVAASPSLLAQCAGALAVVLFVVVGAAFTEHIFDDAAIVGVVLVLALVAYLQVDWALPFVERRSPDIVWRIPTAQPRAALTIDDVPLLAQPTALEELLDVLRENEVKATLFIMSGFNLDAKKGGLEPEARQRCRELLERAVAEGHELGNHTQFDEPSVAMAPEDFDKAFLHCDSLLAELAGGKEAWRARPRRWFRPGSAMWNKHILTTARENGYTTVVANCYPHDVAAVTRHINPCYLQWRVRPGAVVVVHDRWHTPETLRRALPLIKSRGLQLGTLSQLQAAADAEASRKGVKSE